MTNSTDHTTSEGGLRETKYHYDQVMHSANELRFEIPNLEALGVYLR